MRVVVAGGSAAGVFTALLLARGGHDVVVLDRDPVEPAADLEAAAANAFRAAAPHVVQPHAVLPLCRELLRARLADVYAALLAAGVVEAPLPTQMPPMLRDREARPGDERITLLLSRRSTIDWVLRRAVATEPHVDVRGGVQVTGLLAHPGPVPHVTGIRTTAGEVAADLVVDATGRRTPIDRWLAGIGARPTVLEHAECGLAYYSRHYVLGPDAMLPGSPATRIVANLDEFNAGVWCGDNRTALVALMPLAEDKRFRAIADPEVFTAVLRTLPVYAAWLDAMEPVSGVFPMGGLHNSIRRLVRDGSPVVTGLVAVGDTVCTTNPTLGRGLSLALLQSASLADALGADGNGPGEAGELALALDRATTHQIEPFFRDQAATDAARLAQLRSRLFGAPVPAPAPARQRVTVAQLRNAAAYDATALRAFWQVMGMLELPERVYTDPDVVAHTQAVIAEHGDVPPMPQPTTAQLEAALGTASTGGRAASAAVSRRGPASPSRAR